MIILTKEALENNEQFYNTIQKEKELITANIEQQKILKTLLLDYMQKLVDSTDIVDTKDAESIINLLTDFKNSLELLNTNINLLNNCIESLEKISADFETLNNFNTNFFESNLTVSKNTIQIEKVLSSILPYLNFTFQKIDLPSSANIEEVAQENIKEEIIAEPIDEKITQTINNDEYIENTLIISETKGKIILPYTSIMINDTLKNNSDKYSGIEDVIEKEYTLPFDLFKNPAVSRFREAFKLVRKKEKLSIKEAFDLGMELLFNYNLHPAIISACKNLDELDIYLDYLEDNETDKFDCFKIVFEVAPVVIKNSKRS